MAQHAAALICIFQAILLTSAQQVGTISKEAGPVLTIKHCTKAGGCEDEENSLTLDANWRWVHSAKGSDNCYTDGAWDEDLCPDPETCSKNCALDGVDADSYEATYGISKISGGVKLQYVTKGEYGDNVGSRLYMLDGKDTYKMFKLKNREFTFDVEGSTLSCGLNGALYLVEMKEDGGLGGRNKAGAMYGTGYCDAQCPHDVKFMGGKANVNGWDSKTALGKLGHCCTELDLWEANMADTAFTPHPCDTKGPLICHGTKCGDLKTHERYKGVCDKDGCDFNTFRMGNETFYGPGPKFTVDSTKPITVVTRFLTDDGTDKGELTEMRRYYVQDGKIIPNAFSTVKGVVGDAVSDGFCKAQKKVFEDPDDFAKKGSMSKMGEAMDRGMVLVLSLWDDAATDMDWLDATAPAASRRPGARRGPCAQTSGDPKDLRSKHPDASVSYYNFRYGEIGSTVKGISEAKPSPPPSSSAASAPAPAPSSSSAANHASTKAAAGASSASSASRSSSSSSSSSSGSGTSSGTASASSSSSSSSGSGSSNGSSSAASSAPSAASGATETREESFCCLAAAGASVNRCGSCPKSGRVGMESWCGRSSYNCKQCTALAKWCEAEAPAGGSSSHGAEDDDEDEDEDDDAELRQGDDSDGDAAGGVSTSREDDRQAEKTDDDDDVVEGGSTTTSRGTELRAVSDRTSSDDEEDEDDEEDDPLFPRKHLVWSPLATVREHLPTIAVVLLSIGFVGSVAIAVASARMPRTSRSRRTVVGQRCYAHLGEQAAASRLDDPEATETGAAYL